MSMKKSEKGYKQFSKSEKLRILSEAKELGVKVTLEKYDLYPATYYYWKKKFTLDGSEGLDRKRSKIDEKEIKLLRKENEQLKILLAEKELESKLKDEMLKKKYPELRRKS